MPICPNKSTKQWSDLIAGLKAKSPKETDARIDDYANFAFFSKGDGSIPTVDEALAILFRGKTKQVKEDIKETFKSFRAGKKIGEKSTRDMQKSFAQRVKEYVDDLSIRGRISNIQAKTIAKRAAKVGSSEASMAKFTTYVDNVVDKVNYAADLAEMAKLQKAARKLKTFLSPEVRDFTRINPEDIPDAMATKYKQALDLLTGKVQDPSLMRELMPDVTKILDGIAAEKEANVGTIDDALEALAEIDAIELDSVEGYREKIGSINKLKRKLNQLLEAGEITEDEFNSIIDRVGKTQEDFEAKNKAEIKEIKSMYIDEIKSKKIEEADWMTIEEKNLINKINEIRESDMPNMTPEELHVLNEAIDVANDNYVDVAALNEVLDASTAYEAKAVTEQLNNAKTDPRNVAELTKKLLANDDTFWESVIGLPSYKIGELYKQIITPFRRGVGNYVNSLNDVRRGMIAIERGYKMSKEDHNKVGMVVHFLQEYSRQFDPKFKNLKDVGKRDEFSQKLFTKEFTDKISDKKVLKTMQDAYESIPKGADGTVDIADVYNDFVNNGGKYLTPEQRQYVETMWQLFDGSVTSKLEYAAKLRGAPFKRIDFYMPREEYSLGVAPSAKAPVTASKDGRNIRIESPFAKERVAKDIMKSGIPKTDYSQLMHKAAESSIRDYEITRMLHNLNRRLNVAYKGLDGDKRNRLDATVGRIQAGLDQQISAKTSDPSGDTADKILAATAVKALFDFNRAFLVELPAGFASYPIRGGTFAKGWMQALKSPKVANEIKRFTESPLRIKENINAQWDVDSQKLVLPPVFNRITQWLTGFTETHLNNMIYVPKFKDAFFDITGQKFNQTEFMSSPDYRKQYSKEIKEAGTMADAETQEIVGPTTAASGRAVVESIFLRGNKVLPIRKGWGKIVGFMGNYAYRDYSAFVKGLKGAAQGVKSGETGYSLLSASKPIGILVGITTYGYLSDIKRLTDKYLISAATGDEEEFEKAKEDFKKKFDESSAWQELAQNTTQVFAGKYGADARIAVTAAATAAYHAPGLSEKTKNQIKRFASETTYSRIPDLSKAGSGFYGKSYTGKEIAFALGKQIAVIGTVIDRLEEAAGGADAANKLYERYKRGENLGDMDAWGKAMETVVSAAQLAMLPYGLSLPESKKIRDLIENMQTEVKISKGSGRGRPSSRGRRTERQ
jgi:hypothetical protein